MKLIELYLCSYTIEIPGDLKRVYYDEAGN